MNRHLFLTCESGKLLQFDKETCRHDVLYQHQANEYLFGIACHGNLLYFAGCTFLATGQTSRDGFQLREVVKPLPGATWGAQSISEVPMEEARSPL